MRRRIVAALERYAATGYGDVVRVETTDQLRLRVGDWRVRFRSRVERRRLAEAPNDPTPAAEVRVIEVVIVRPRGSAYRD